MKQVINLKHSSVQRQEDTIEQIFQELEALSGKQGQVLAQKENDTF